MMKSIRLLAIGAHKVKISPGKVNWKIVSTCPGGDLRSPTCRSIFDKNETLSQFLYQCTGIIVFRKFCFISGHHCGAGQPLCRQEEKTDETDEIWRRGGQEGIVLFVCVWPCLLFVLVVDQGPSSYIFSVVQKRMHLKRKLLTVQQCININLKLAEHWVLNRCMSTFFF